MGEFKYLTVLEKVAAVFFAVMIMLLVFHVDSILILLLAMVIIVLCLISMAKRSKRKGVFGITVILSIILLVGIVFCKINTFFPVEYTGQAVEKFQKYNMYIIKTEHETSFGTVQNEVICEEDIWNQINCDGTEYSFFENHSGCFGKLGILERASIVEK